MVDEKQTHSPNAEGRTAGLRIVKSMMRKVAGEKSSRLITSSARKGERFECAGFVGEVLAEIPHILEVQAGGIVQSERKNELRTQVPVILGMRTVLCTLSVSGEQYNSICRIQMRRSMCEAMCNGSEEFDIVCFRVFDRLVEKLGAVPV